MLFDKELTLEDVKKEIDKKGEYVQIERLNKILGQKTSQNVKKFAFMRLAEIYEKKIMYSDAAVMCHNLSMYSSDSAERNRYHMKEAELYLKAGKPEMAEETMKKAMCKANPREIASIIDTMKELYKAQAIVCEKNKRKSQALEIYDKILRMDISDMEKRDIKKKMLELYDGLGRVRDYLNLERELSGNKI